jgi:L-seryl-tRNA(Ser) seleniumtransferase
MAPPLAVAHPKRYRNDVDLVLGYAPGTIIADEVAEYRCVRAAEEVLLARYRRAGLDGLVNLMSLGDDCAVPEEFRGPEYRTRFLATKLLEERLDRLAKAHLGGDERHSTLAFTRTAAANLTALLALAPAGTTVPYLVCRYPSGDGSLGHGHPSIPRGAELARARAAIVTTVEALERLLDRERCALVAICPSYRGIMPEGLLEAACRLARRRGLPTFVDDASGARTRVVGDGQRRALDLGADLAITSCEKYGLFGPRAGLMVGRRDLMERIGAKMVILGTEARPSVVAAIVRCLEEYHPGRVARLYREWTEAHRELYEAGRPIFGERLLFKEYNGVILPAEAVLEIAMERAGLDATDLAPVDASMALAMLLLRRHGYLTVTALHYPGASKVLALQRTFEAARRLPAATIVAAVDRALDELAAALADRGALERILFGPPD